MKKLAIGTVLGAGLLLLGGCDSKSKSGGGAATAEEAKKDNSHILATKEPGFPAKGSTLTIESSTGMKDAKMTVEGAGQKVDGTMTNLETNVETVVYLGGNKVRRTLESKSITGATIMAGQTHPLQATKEHPLLGIPVLGEYKDGKWTATLESGTPNAEQAKALENLNQSLQHDSALEMYGDVPRKVGDKWNVDPKNLTVFGDAKNLSGTFATELVEIRDFQGVPCAVLKSQFEVTGEGEMEEGDGSKMTMKMKGEATTYRSLGDKVDLEFTVSSALTMDGSPGPGMKIHMEGPFGMTRKTTVKKP